MLANCLCDIMYYMNNIEIRNYNVLLGLPGFSENMLKNHFTLYEGYVKNVKILSDKSKTLIVGSPEYNELRRRFSWEWNGMKLHELYFENLTKDAKEISQESSLYNNLVTSFGSFENWVADFEALGMTRGIGWAVLVSDNVSGKMMNIWIGEHNFGLLVNTKILLVMDVWEHAYMTDYDIKRVDYIKNFMDVIDWSVVQNRFEK